MSTALVPAAAGQSNNELAQLVSFSLNHEEYGVEVLKVREIIRMVGVTKMPNAPDYVEGVINLRGKVIPVISLRRRFGLPEQENSSRTRTIIMDLKGELLGFVVDAVSEVIRISAGEIQPPPATTTGGGEQECIAGIINRSERLLVLLDLDRMLSSEDMQLFA